MAVNTLGLNRTFPIYNADGTSFNNLELRKAVVDSIVMSLGDKITGEVYYKDNSLAVTMHEYIDYNDVHYMLVNPPTVVREGMVSDNGQLNGMTKYSFGFYHPMYLLGNIPFNDVAVTADETRYLSENAVFSWIGYPDDLIAKLNKNLQGTEWIVVKSSRFPNEKDNELSEVIPFNNAMISDVLKTFYDTWEVPFVIGQVESTEAAYAQGKRFKVIFGLPYNEIYETPEDRSGNIPFVFQFGQGVGLKNNSRTPRNNKIVTRIAGYGAERNVPYGYPQIPWYGDSRWDWTEYEGDVINYDINDKVTNNPKSTAYPIYDGIVSGQPTRLIKHPFTRTHLMPSIYGELLFNKVSPYVSGGDVNPSYNPNIQLKDFYDAIATQEYPYINEINPSAPSYQFKEFEKIYPELGEEYIYGVQPLNDDLTPAPDWDDSIDNDGNYNQSYFAITLPILSFDIYASAAITEEMEINMRSGACLGCTFQVQVDWEDYKNNFFNSDGEFDPIPHTAENDGHVRDAKKYPDSSQTRVTVIVKKDLETFGTLMPNIYQYPIAGDQFVVLGISVPQSYISNAEARLDAEMKTYMLENNVYYFDYPLKFDEKFLRDNTYILSQLRPNSIVRFNYAGQQLQLYVKQLTVKYGEKPLPQYDITLTDNVEVVLNQLGQVADDVERLSTLISIVRENYSRSVWAELAKKLSKVDDDTAQGTIRFLKGLQVGSRFVSGLLGSGGIFRRNADGKTYLETDNLYVRMKAYFDTVEVREYEHSHGGRIASSAGQKVSHVVKMGYYPEGSQTKVPLDDDNYYHYIDHATGDETLIPLDVCCYRCYYRAKENSNTTEQATRQNTFKRGDMARCHMVNDSLNQKDYWRIVDETNEYDTFYNGEYGWTDLTNEAHFDVTGTSTCWGYMGASSGEAADVPEMGDDLYQLGSVTDADRQGAIVEATTGNDTPAYRIYQSVGKDLRPTPAQGQPPLSEFDPFTLEDRDYINLFYNSSTGRAQMDVYGDAYIGAKDGSTYINYNAGTRKLNIKAIVDIAGGFLDGGTQKTFDQLLSGRTYTQAQVDAMIEGIQEQIDGEIDTWFYDFMPVATDASGAPANRVPLTNVKPYATWYTADGGGTASEVTTERTKHLGDIFYDNTSGYAFRFSKDENTGDFEWVEITDSAVIKALRDAANAQDTADNKRRVFVAQPAPIPPKTYVEYDVGDLWTNANFTGSDSHGQAVVYSNDLLRCITAKPIRDAQGNITDGTFSIDDWQLASKYTDDSTLLTFLDGYQGNLTNIRTQVDRKAETWRQATDPSTVARPNGWLGEQDSEHVGDIWMDTTQNGGNKTKIFQDNGDSANPRYVWEEQAVPDEVFDEIDGKAALYTDYDDWYDSINNVNNLQIRDLYIPYRNYPIESTDAAATYKTNKVYRCTYAGDYTRNPVTPPTFQEIAYTNDDVFNGYISQVLNGTGATGDSAVVANAIRAIKGALNEGTLVDGGLVLTGFIGLRQNGLLWSGMSGQYDSLQTTGGIAAWYGGGFVDYETLTDAQKAQGWNVIRWARSLFRFDGSGYLADGNITWDKNGNIAIRDITTLLDGNNTDILNELVTFNNAFHFSTQQGSTTVLSISPQAGFTSLNITESGVLKPVATQEWVGQNYVSAAFFNAIFQLQDANGNAITPNNATTAKDRLKILVGAYTDQYLSALGLNPNSGGGGGTGDVTWTALAQTATDNRTIDWSYIANAVTQQGYITSALLAAYLTTNGYATQSWVGQQGFLTSQDITANLINNALGFTLSGTSGSTYNLDNFALASALSGYLPLTGGTITGSLNIDGGLTVGDPVTIGDTLSVNDDIFMMNKLVATREWVGLNYTDTVTLNTMLGNYLLKSGGTMTGTLYMGTGTFFRLYEDANSYASIYASATDGLSIGFSGGAAVASINLDANTTINAALDVTGNVTVGHPNTNGGYIQIGGVRLVYDSTNNALYVVSSDGSTAANFYATGGNSALGYSPSGSGGGGTGDVTWTALAAQAANNRTIHSSYIADTLANYLLVSGGTVTGDLTLLGNVFATTSAFNINHLYLTTGFRIQMVDRLNNNQSAFAFDTNNNFVFSLGTHNAKFIASDLLVGTNTVWHGGNFPLAISSPTSGQVLKFNGTSWVNDAAPTGGGTVTSITAGTGLSGGTITGSGTIAIDSTYQTHISNGNTAYGWGNHANAGYALASALASYLPLSAGTSYPITGALCLSALNEIRLYQDSTHYAKITPDTLDGLTIGFSAGNTMNQLNLPSNTYIGSDIVASQNWVGQQGFALASAIPTNNNQLTNGAGYITASALNGYATQTWVGQQGYITSSSISDMATMTWVANQDYVSTSDLNTTLSGYATESYVTSRGYITSSGSCASATYCGYFTQHSVDSSYNANDLSNGVFSSANTDDPTNMFGTNNVMLSIAGQRNDKLQIGYSMNNGDRIYARCGYLVGSSEEHWYSWHTLAYTDDLSSYLPLSGGTITGNLTCNGNIYTNYIYAKNSNDRIYIEGTVGVDIHSYSPNLWINWGDRGILIDGYGDHGAQAAITTKDCCPLSISADGSVDQIYINSTGCVGIGTRNMSHKLHVNGTGYFYDTLTAAGGISTPNGVNISSGGSISAAGGISCVNGFTKANCDNTSVLLAGGGHQALSSFITNPMTTNLSFNSGCDIRLYDDSTHYSRIYADSDGLNIQFTNASGNQLDVQGDLIASEIYENSARVATRSWVSGLNISTFTNDSGYITSSGSCAYATSAGNADTVDGVHNGSLTCAYINTFYIDSSSSLDYINDGFYKYTDGNNPTNAVGNNGALIQIAGRFWDRFQLIFPGNDYGRVLYRHSTYSTDSTYVWSAWKSLAFADDCLPLTGGTVSGAIVCNGGITSTGDLNITTAAGRNIYISPPSACTFINWGDKGIFINGWANSGTQAAITTKNNCPISIAGDGSVSQLYLASGGNVGIGTTSPSYKLDVNGAIRASGNISTDQGYNISSGGSVSAAGGISCVSGFTKAGYDDNYLLKAGGGVIALSSFLTNPMTTHLSFNSSCDIRMYDDSTHYTNIHEDSDGLNIVFTNSNSNGNLVVAGGIENTGSVTVGNTLTVNGTTTSVGTIYGSSSLYLEGDLYIRDTLPQGGGAFYWHIDGNGYGVMTVSGGTAVAFTCQVNATSFNQTSDARKKNISDYDVEPNLWDIAYAPAIRYTWKEGRDKANHVGSLAQYWKAILPEAVTESFDGYLGMQYDVIALLSAISIAKKTVEHERRISELERRVGTLESENSYLRSQINELKAA